MNPPQQLPCPPQTEKPTLILQIDEQGSYVGSKKQQRWLFYAYEPRSKRIIAHVLGPRTKATLRVLLDQLSGFNVSFFCTDGWEPYRDLLPKEKHIQGKRYTQNIERENLNLRQQLKRLARKTIGFSRSIELHDKVIGEWIYRNHSQMF